LKRCGDLRPTLRRPFIAVAVTAAVTMLGDTVAGMYEDVKNIFN
jgi:hypothetical protein